MGYENKPEDVNYRRPSLQLVAEVHPPLNWEGSQIMDSYGPLIMCGYLNHRFPIIKSTCWNSGQWMLFACFSWWVSSPFENY